MSDHSADRRRVTLTFGPLGADQPDMHHRQTNVMRHSGRAYRRFFARSPLE